MMIGKKILFNTVVHYIHFVIRLNQTQLITNKVGLSCVHGVPRFFFFFYNFTLF